MNFINNNEMEQQNSNSNFNGIDNNVDEYRSQCKQFHADLLESFEKNEENNLGTRLEAMVRIVNNSFSSSSSISIFDIDQTQFDEMMTFVKPDIYKYTQVCIEKCSQKIKTIDEYKRKARNMLNRWKPKTLGNHVFHRVVFIDIYNHCCKIGRANGDDDDEIKNKFVSILEQLLSESVLFQKTRPQPLILHTMLEKDNLFKRGCMALLHHFGEDAAWDRKSGNAKTKFHAFRKCLKLLYDKKNISIPPCIILEKMKITRFNILCANHYKAVITKFVVNCETEEGMNNEEKISVHCGILNVINIFHHHAIQFWTITPQQNIFRDSNKYKNNPFKSSPHAPPAIPVKQEKYEHDEDGDDIMMNHGNAEPDTNFMHHIQQQTHHSEVNNLLTNNNHATMNNFGLNMMHNNNMTNDMNAVRAPNMTNGDMVNIGNNAMANNNNNYMMNNFGTNNNGMNNNNNNNNNIDMLLNAFCGNTNFNTNNNTNFNINNNNNNNSNNNNMMQNTANNNVMMFNDGNGNNYFLVFVPKCN